MKAIQITEPGGPDVLVWTDVADPQPGAGEVLIDVAASAVNRADLLQRAGRYPPPAGASDILGLECSGRIAALGEGVTGWNIGDEVCALLAGGGYAQRVAVPAGQVLPAPKGIDLVSAGALPETVCTVWSNVFMGAGLQPRETLLVHGGAGGIGTTAIQLGKAVGARVIATAGSPRKLARCRELGAQAAIDYREEDFVARLHELTAGHGADVILDNMGASYLSRNVEALAVNGRLVIIGLQGGVRGELDLGRLMAKRAAVLATGLRARPVAEKAAIVAAVREHVWPLVDAGRLTVVSERRFPMAEAAEAHRLVESSGHVGKVLLVV
ncbi:NAD(P)H-quinone oxidoreductase [Actinocrinis puniceicyclus]|uniref:NAD(P)H-quinone oxidoreductase n=1 Tax=Actinocrinis puniceicyclus TaxID=977794 RepID=A0A8J7WJ64_9ACTN|nr:NAD(P)H-quinone oxidoreductase [Actinocrinis puniceicyclus]MBS2963286.1 NAD(P)H-quinone oxidoreductase [Actinocrinis puniceicyclus]